MLFLAEMYVNFVGLMCRAFVWWFYVLFTVMRTFVGLISFQVCWSYNFLVGHLDDDVE